MIVYDKFWGLLKEKEISQYALIKRHKVSTGQLGRMRKNMNISTHTVDMFCDILKCNVEDIMEHIPNKKE